MSANHVRKQGTDFKLQVWKRLLLIGGMCVIEISTKPLQSDDVRTMHSTSWQINSIWIQIPPVYLCAHFCPKMYVLWDLVQVHFGICEVSLLIATCVLPLPYINMSQRRLVQAHSQACSSWPWILGSPDPRCLSMCPESWGRQEARHVCRTERNECRKTSCHRYTFHITGLLCREPVGYQWIHSTNDQYTNTRGLVIVSLYQLLKWYALSLVWAHHNGSRQITHWTLWHWIYLRSIDVSFAFLSFLYNEMVQVVVILPCGNQWPVCIYCIFSNIVVDVLATFWLDTWSSLSFTLVQSGYSSAGTP